MTDYSAQFLLNDFALFQGKVDSIPQEVFLDVSAPRTSPTITITPTTGSSVTRTASIQVDVTDDLASLADVTIWAVLADGTTETIWNGAAYTAKFSGGTTSPLALGTRFTFAYGGFGWPTTAVTIWAKAVDPVGAAATPVSAAYTISNPPAAPVVTFSPVTGGSQTRTATVSVDVTDEEGASSLALILIHAVLDDGTERTVAVGATIKAPFSVGSERASIANGYRYLVAWDAPGWPSTTAGLRVDAMDALGQTTSATWSATITNPPAAPVIGNFSPANLGTTTRAGTVRLDVTDDEGASAIAHVTITALLSDGTVRVVYDGDGAADFGPEVDAGSSRSSVSGGYRYEVVYDGDGWPSSSLLFTVRAEDAQGRATEATLSLTITDPPAPPDETVPTVTFDPPLSTELQLNQPFSVTVTDPGILRRMIVRVTFPSGDYEDAWDGYAITPRYAAASSLQSVDGTGGKKLTVMRTGGWPAAPSPNVYAIDNAGNEA